MNKRLFDLTEIEMNAARIMLDPKITQEEAARRTNLSTRTLRRKSRMPEFVAYQQLLREGQQEAMQEAYQEVTREDAKRETKATLQARELDLAKLPTQVELILSLWEMVKIPPERTKGSLQDQRQSVKDIWEIMGFKSVEKTEDVVAAPDVYEAAWMKKPQ